jgi:general secretion pathway protein H
MPYSRITRLPIGNRIGLPSRGFSLLELMLVMVVIGILVAIFTLSVGSFSDDQTSEDVRRLEALMLLASEEASMQGRDIGLRFYQHGYEFSARSEAEDEEGNKFWVWLPLDEDRLLRPRDLGEEISVELLIENRDVDLEFDRDSLKETELYQPQIFLFSSGDLTPPFTARFRPEFANTAVVLTVSPEGKTELSVDDF